MQKAKSVLVKVLVLICVLCCSISLAFGLTGCKDGADEHLHVFTAKGTEYHTCEFSVCQHCGTADPNFVDEHGTYAWIEVVDNGANRCVDGYHEIYVCLDCLKHCTNCEDAITDTREIEATGHVIDVDTWAVDVEPTLESAGSYKGFCTACGTNATIVLPKLDKEDDNYEYVQTIPPQCNSDGTDTYTFKYFGVELAECVFTVTTTAHTDANGLVIDKNKVYELEYVQTYGDVEVDGEPTCQETCRGILYCKDCNGVIIVKVKGNCQWEKTSTVAPDCVNGGYEVWTCSVCGATENRNEVGPI